MCVSVCVRPLYHAVFVAEPADTATGWGSGSARLCFGLHFPCCTTPTPFRYKPTAGIAFCISCAFSIPATIQEGGLTMSPCRFAQAKMYIWNRTEYSLACYLLSVSCVGGTSDQASQGIANCMINSNPLINWPISPPGSIKYFWFWLKHRPCLQTSSTIYYKHGTSFAHLQRTHGARATCWLYCW